MYACIERKQQAGECADTFAVSVSFLELYNEQLLDLLLPPGRTHLPLDVREVRDRDRARVMRHASVPTVASGRS